MLWLAAAAGATQLLAPQAIRGFHLDLAGRLLVALVAGPMLGVIGIYVAAAIFSGIAGWFGGTGGSDRVRVALAWSAVPALAMAPFNFLLLVLSASAVADGFGQGAMLSRRSFAGVVGVIGVISLVLGLWQLVLGVRTLAVAKNFSTGRAIATFVLPIFLLVGAFLSLIMLLRA